MVVFKHVKRTQLRQLTIQLTRTKDKTPLAVIQNLPGGDAELQPAQMRALAAAILQAAEECEVQPMKDREFRPVTKNYCW